MNSETCAMIKGFLQNTALLFSVLPTVKKTEDGYRELHFTALARVFPFIISYQEMDKKKYNSVVETVVFCDHACDTYLRFEKKNISVFDLVYLKITIMNNSYVLDIRKEGKV